MNVRTARLAALPMFALVLGTIAQPAGADQSRDLNWSGSVRAGTTLAWAKTVNGNIDARVDDAKWPGSLSFATVNGSINVAVPAGASFTVRARTLNGTIDARSFGLEPNRGFVGRTLDGTVGSNADGKSISLKTINGSIALSSLGAAR